ncbi:MAG: FtsX-like permease family protein, partial [Verrucomicrobia bacterium]|nr:FtsX-like permease family protein [Verrucomicrobiota bacterium]
GRDRAASDGTSPPRPAVAATEDASPIAMASAILSHLPPSSAGLAFAPVRADGIRAGTGATDFAQLFIGLGFFIVAAALMLAGLLFGLALAARAPETGLLRALGYRRNAIRSILLGEAALVATAAAAVGSAAGIGMAGAILDGLRTLWHGAVGTTALALAVRPPTVLAGAAAGLLAALGAAFLVLRRQEFRAVHELQTGGAEDLSPPARRPARRLATAVVALAAAAGLRLAAGGGAGPGVLLGAGALALVGGLFLSAWILARLASGRGSGDPDPRVFGARNWARRPRRSVAAILMPACGVFLVFAVGANRPTVTDPESRTSGTGGFAFVGTTALPMARDPGTAEGRTLYDLPAAATDGVHVLALRRRGGDDASCLNLNRVAQPPLIGVPAATFAELGAFRFTKLAPAVDPARPWSCLALDLGPGVLPVVVDESVALWSLKKKIGDRIATTGERGRPVQLQIVGLLADSVFQGNLLAADDAFLLTYPSATLQMLLVDAPPAQRDAVQRILEDRLGDVGLDLPTTAARLDSFLAVQRTYLDIFLAFGAIGLLIGAAGFGVVANRNLIERRREFGLLHALGYPHRRLLRGAVAEHAALASIGLAIGALSALFAIPPGIPAGSTLTGLALVLAGMALIATLTSALSARSVLRAPALDALKEE